MVFLQTSFFISKSRRNLLRCRWPIGLKPQATVLALKLNSKKKQKANVLKENNEHHELYILNLGTAICSVILLLILDNTEAPPPVRAVDAVDVPRPPSLGPFLQRDLESWRSSITD